MKANQMRVFEGTGIVACVLLQGGEDCLGMSEHGVLVIPQGVEPQGFHLLVAVKEGSRTFVVQKDVGNTGGDYGSKALSQLSGFAPGFRATIMRDPIDIIRKGNNVWTGWHQAQASNRVDCWTLESDGRLDLFQIGIVTHDNGKTFVLHGEYRWRGQLYSVTDGRGEVAKPEHPKWGSLEGGTSHRTQIFQHHEMMALLSSLDSLPSWQGAEEDLNPPLPKVENDLAVVDWYVFFAGQTGQGIVKTEAGNSYWVHGVDVEGFDPASSEPPLWRGDIVYFKDMVDVWGAKKGGPPKLIGVRLIHRDW